MTLSTEGRALVQNRIDYLRRRAGFIVGKAREDIVAATADIAVAKALVDEADLLALDLEDDAQAEWTVVEVVPVPCSGSCALCTP